MKQLIKTVENGRTVLKPVEENVYNTPVYVIWETESYSPTIKVTVMKNREGKEKAGYSIEENSVVDKIGKLYVYIRSVYQIVKRFVYTCLVGKNQLLEGKSSNTVWIIKLYHWTLGFGLWLLASVALLWLVHLVYMFWHY